MPDLSAFPITQRWPAKHPDRLQLYSLPTPNGVKVSIMLEEIGLPYEPHLVDIMKNESATPEFVSLNPNGKIPAILDPDGPNGEPLVDVPPPPSGDNRYTYTYDVTWDWAHRYPPDVTPSERPYARAAPRRP